MMSGQSRRTSLVETLAGTASGFLLSLWLQHLLFPALGHEMALRDHMLVASVFTVASLLRGYALRRLFNALRDTMP